MHIQRGPKVRSAILAAFTTLVVLSSSPAFAHEWEELDVSRVLAQADAIITVAEIVQAAWIRDETDATDPAEAPEGAPPELRWWTWVQDRSVTGGAPDILAAIQDTAPEWLADEDGDPDADAHTDLVRSWVDALGELVAHAAARTVTMDDRTAATNALSSPALSAADAQRASWIVLLPVLTDDEARDLAPAFARLDALIAEVAP